MTTPLEDFAMIGDGETIALVSRQGSIDWLCLPRFDSPACCAALLGTSEHGCWSIAPYGPITRSEQRYQADTMVLETDLSTDDGTIRIIDFMPVRDGKNPLLVRRVSGLSGTVRTRLDGNFRFDYGNMPPWITERKGGASMHVGPDRLVLEGPSKFQIDGGNLSSRFDVKEGQTLDFVLTYSAAETMPSDGIDVEAALKETQGYWREWIGAFDRDLPYADAVKRSLLVLKCLIHRPTGGLVAAPTTSLPEQPGGTMNWDYRYCWLRDATFTVNALTECGYLEEASAWRDWILRAVAGAPDKMQIMYRVDGSRRLDEAELDWLPGYRFAKPVRVGNAAAGQLQLDVWGELVAMLHAAEKAGMERSEQGEKLGRAVVSHVERIWEEPDQGLWESRGEPRHYTYSKVMAWTAIQRHLDSSAAKDLSKSERTRLAALRDHMHAVICREGFDEGLNSFTAYFGGQTVDAGLLLLPKVGFLPGDDPRMVGTVAMIEKELVKDGFVHRHLMADIVPEGAFLACSFWLAECLLWQDRKQDAVRTIEAVLAIASPQGLLSEEYDMHSRRLTGNYPQALSHLALIHAVLALDAYDRLGHHVGVDL